MVDEIEAACIDTLPPAPPSPDAAAVREACARMADQEAIDSALLHDATHTSARRREAEQNRVAGAQRIAAAIRALPLPKPDAAQVEVDRLREALEEIAGLRIAGSVAFPSSGPTIAEFARAALHPAQQATET